MCHPVSESLWWQETRSVTTLWTSSGFFKKWRETLRYFIVAGFINQQVNWHTGTIFLFLNFCGTWDKESREIRNEGRKMNEWTPVAYRNGDLVDMHIWGIAQYCFVLLSNLGTQMLKLDRCWISEILLYNTISCALRQTLGIRFNS